MNQTQYDAIKEAAFQDELQKIATTSYMGAQAGRINRNSQNLSSVAASASEMRAASPSVRRTAVATAAAAPKRGLGNFMSQYKGMKLPSGTFDKMKAGILNYGRSASSAAKTMSRFI